MPRTLALILVLVGTACSDDAASSTPTDTGGDDAPADTAGDAAPDTTADAIADAADEGGVDLGPRNDTCVGPAEAAIDNAAMPSGYCAWTWASGLRRPRGVAMVGGDLLVVEAERAQVAVLWDDDADGVSGAGERAVLASAPGLNHGVVVHGGYLYASSTTTVYRWPYTAGTRTELSDRETVVQGFPDGGHATRTLAFDADGRLYVTVGSGGNVDANADRARMMRYTLPDPLAAPIAWGDGELFAEGMRNVVGLGWDAQGRLWGVENGIDNLNREDLGGDIHNDNPAEEVNLFVEPGRFYGYPYCWSEFSLPAGVGMGPGTQWVTPQFMSGDEYTDAWCQNPDNVVLPAFSMQAHSAPLDITFYDGASFPAEVVGDALVSFHGSWNRDLPTGYKVMRLHFQGGQPVSISPLFEYDGASDIDAEWRHRPVGIVVGPNGEVYVSSDRDGLVLALGHQGS